MPATAAAPSRGNASLAWLDAFADVALEGLEEEEAFQQQVPQQTVPQHHVPQQHVLQHYVPQDQGDEGFLVFDSLGTTFGKDLEILTLAPGQEPWSELWRAKQIAREKNYAGFVLHKGTAFFKSGTQAQICGAMVTDPNSALFVRYRHPVAIWQEWASKTDQAVRTEKTNVSGVWVLQDVCSEQVMLLHLYHAPGEHRFYGRGGVTHDQDIDRHWISSGVLSAQNYVEFWTYGRTARYRAKVLDQESRFISGIICGSGVDATIKSAFVAQRVSGEEEIAAFTPTVVGGKASWQAMLVPPRELLHLPPTPGQVKVVRTCSMGAEYFSILPPLQLQAVTSSDSEPTILIEPSRRFQSFLGFGGSFTESAADLLLKLSEGQQERVVDACFHPRKGLAYRLGRVHINSCDFSEGNWSCCDQAGDAALSSFSINRYKRALVPFMTRARATAGHPLGIVASPWSPPWWMKDNNQMVWGGRLKPEYRAAWAQFYIRFAEAMKAVGVPISYLTVQNEPAATQKWESCRLSSEDERVFVRDYLGPALARSGLGLKLLVWDHNRDGMFARARDIYMDVSAADYVWGCAFHWYGDPKHEDWPNKGGQVCFDNVECVHNLRPDKHLIMTEACQEKGAKMGEWNIGERYAANIIRDLNNWTEGWIDWNLLLDTGGGPNHKENFCSAPLIVSPAHDAILYQPSYYFLGHFSRYIDVGAQRLLCSNCSDSLLATAFANPDGSVVAVVLNQSEHNLTYKIQRGGEAAAASAPAHSITTFIFDGLGRAV